MAEFPVVLSTTLPTGVSESPPALRRGAFYLGDVDRAYSGNHKATRDRLSGWLTKRGISAPLKFYPASCPL